MEAKKLSLSRRLSLGAMVASLTLLFLYASEVLTGFRFLCAALSGLFIVIFIASLIVVTDSSFSLIGDEV